MTFERIARGVLGTIALFCLMLFTAGAFAGRLPWLGYALFLAAMAAAWWHGALMSHATRFELAPQTRTPGDCVTDLMAELDAAIARRDETPMVYVPPTIDLPDQED